MPTLTPENVSVSRSGVYFSHFGHFRSIQGLFGVFYVIYGPFSNKEIPPLPRVINVAISSPVGTPLSGAGLFLDPTLTKWGTGGRGTELFALSGPFSNRALSYEIT